MAVLAVTNTLVSGAVITGSGLNTNFSDIVTWLNNKYSGVDSWSSVVTSGAVTVGTTLAVSGTSTLSSTLSVAGATTLSSSASVGGNLSVSRSSAGATVSSTIANTDNTNTASNSTLTINSGGASGGDPYLLYGVTGATNCIQGIDNSDSDKFKISFGASLGTTDYFIINPSTTGVSISGTNTNDSAAASFVGEEVRSSVVIAANVSSSAVYQDFTSISLTAGDWDVTGQLKIAGNGATWTAYAMAVSINSGNTATDHVTGDNAWTQTTAAASYNNETFGLTIAQYRLSLSGTTTVYLKGRVTFSAGTPQLIAGRISARRRR